jgi:hypothetical protein
MCMQQVGPELANFAPDPSPFFNEYKGRCSRQKIKGPNVKSNTYKGSDLSLGENERRSSIIPWDDRQDAELRRR